MTGEKIGDGSNHSVLVPSLTSAVMAGILPSGCVDDANQRY